MRHKNRKHTNVLLVNQYGRIDFDTKLNMEEVKQAIVNGLKGPYITIPGPDGDSILLSKEYLAISVIHINPAAEDLTTEE